MAKVAAKSTAAPGFSFASAIVKASPPKSGSKTVEYFVRRTADRAALKHMRDLIESALEDVDGEIETAAMAGYYIAQGCANKAKPANFTSTETGHSVTCILGKRRSNSFLTEDEATLLDEHSIPYDTQDGEDTFELNNEALANPKIRAKFEALIAEIMASDGVTPVFKVPAKPKRAITDESVTAAFKLKADVAELVLPVVTMFSMRSKWQVVANNMAPLVERVGQLLNLPGMIEKLDMLTETRAKKKKQWAA